MSVEIRRHTADTVALQVLAAHDLVADADESKDVEAGPSTDLETATVQVKPQNDPVAGVAAMEAFRDEGTPRSRSYVFWGAFVLFTVSLALSNDTTYLYLAFATSNFASNPILSTIALLIAVLSGVCQPFWGRLADASRRSWCLALSVALYTVGYALSAGCTSVQGLAAGQVIYALAESSPSSMQRI